MIFVETALYSKLIDELLSEDEQIALQWYLMAHPDAGAVVAGSGGVRKLRWGARSGGKRGGVRVVYVWRQSASKTWLLTVYPKNQRSSIPSHILRQIAQEIDDE